jgi:hypothetical protein
VGLFAPYLNTYRNTRVGVFEASRVGLLNGVEGRLRQASPAAHERSYLSQLYSAFAKPNLASCLFSCVHQEEGKAYATQFTGVQSGAEALVGWTASGARITLYLGRTTLRYTTAEDMYDNKGIGIMILQLYRDAMVLSDCLNTPCAGL